MAPLEIRHRSVRPISAKHAQASRFLQQSLEARPLGEMAERWQELAAATRHFEFFVFPYADTVIFKSLQPVAGEGVMPRSTDIDERPFRIACELSRKANFLIPSLQRLMMRLSSKPSRRVGPAQFRPGCGSAIESIVGSPRIPRAQESSSTCNSGD
jgi:hypothetical protein